MIEAMACGTPVLAFRNGSVAEVIDDGVTGHIVENVDEAIPKIGSLIGLGSGPRPPALRAAVRVRTHGARLRPRLPNTVARFHSSA